MKISLAVLSAALGLLAIVLAEFALGFRWSMQAWHLPDFDLKPFRPMARFAFTGVVMTLTILFGGALLRAQFIRDNR